MIKNDREEYSSDDSDQLFFQVVLNIEDHHSVQIHVPNLYHP